MCLNHMRNSLVVCVCVWNIDCVQPLDISHCLDANKYENLDKRENFLENRLKQQKV